MDTLSSHGLKKDRIAGISFNGAVSMRSDHVGVLKTRLRSSVSQERLEAFMLMSVKREQLEKLSSKTLSMRFRVRDSAELKRLLVV